MLTLEQFSFLLVAIGVVGVVIWALRMLASLYRHRPDRAWKTSGYKYRYEGMDDALRVRTLEKRKMLEQHLQGVKRAHARPEQSKTLRSVGGGRV